MSDGKTRTAVGECDVDSIVDGKTISPVRATINENTKKSVRRTSPHSKNVFEAKHLQNIYTNNGTLNQAFKQTFKHVLGLSEPRSVDRLIY